MIVEASKLAKLGWSLIPVKPGEKKPAVKWKPYQSKRAGADQLNEWFASDKYGMAVVLGKVSGDLACRDFDEAEAYHSWAEQHKLLAETLPTAETYRGHHVYFRAETRTAIGSDGELKGERSYCLVPPSAHSKGGSYSWLIEPNDENLLDLVPHEVGLWPKVPASVTETAEDIVCSLCDSEGLVGDAIRATLPHGPGQRHRQVFEFARAIKGIPDLAGADLRMLRPYVKQWHAAALPFIRTKDFLETWFDFGEGLGKVKSKRGELMASIMERVRSKPNHPVCSEMGYSADVSLLVGLCRELQQENGSEPFYLSCATGEKLLGKDRQQVWRWLRCLCIDKVLVLVTKGTTRKATRYRFVADGESERSQS